MSFGRDLVVFCWSTNKWLDFFPLQMAIFRSEVLVSGEGGIG